MNAVAAPYAALPSVTSRRARELVSRFAGQRMLVVGDVMVDRFLVGSVSRISPEAPTPVVRFQSEYSLPGGAGNAARTLAALGAEVALIAVVGADLAGETLRRQLRASGVEVDLLLEDGKRRTLERVRVVSDRCQHIARVDYEHDDASGGCEAAIVSAAARAARDAAAVLVIDYLDGVVSGALMQSLLAATHGGAPLLVRPQLRHLSMYSGASIVVTDEHDAETATRRRIRSEDDLGLAAAAMRRLAGCEAALVHRGDKGVWLSAQVAEGPSVAGGGGADVAGVGSAVIATAGLALAAGATLPEAAVLASRAASVVLHKFGPAIVTAAELRESLWGTIGICPSCRARARRRPELLIDREVT